MDKTGKAKQLKIFSFFAGSGFLDLGFEANGFLVEFVNEFSAAFIAAYKHSRQVMGIRKPVYGYANTDINEFLTTRSAELTDYITDARKDNSLVGFIGGPPCPDFSVAGKQRGADGDNGKLSLAYIELIIKQKPDFFCSRMLEGYGGLLNIERITILYYVCYAMRGIL